MAANLRYVYDLRTNHVFLKHKCNFRLDLMHYKSLLITLLKILYPNLHEDNAMSNNSKKGQRGFRFPEVTKAKVMSLGREQAALS